MIKKSFIPESFDFGMPSVEIIGATQKGLDKTAMVKRASAFDDVLEHLTKRANRTYLHVITTGAFEKYGPNANCFIAGTPVVTDKGFVPIEKVQVGDNVMTHSGKFEPVVRSISRSYNGQLVTVYAKGMKPVTMTYNHPVFTVYDETIQDGIYRAASYIHKDTKLLSYVAKTKTFKVIPVASTKVEQPNPSVMVYNLEVLHDHSYCVPYVVHNCDAWNGDKLDMEIPYPEKGVSKIAHFDGGLSMYHDDTYMKNGAVYQEHKTASAGEKPSGEVLAARYNKPMARGELIIAVDNEKWASRLDRKAKGNDIYLSIGARVPYDTCFPKGTLVLSEFGYQKIESLEIWDRVLTNSGEWQPVVATSEHYTSSITRLQVLGLPLELECTPNHPFMVVEGAQWDSCQGSTTGGRKRRHAIPTIGGVCHVCGHTVNTEAHWKSAGDIQKNDFLKVHLDPNSPVNTVGESFAYLCGMYVGDGSMITERTGHAGSTDGCGKYVGISISASAAERDRDIVQRILECYTRVTGKVATVRPDGNKNAYVIQCYDKLLASRLFDYCYVGSKTKYVSADMLTWSTREKAAFLAGYIDADGCVTAQTNTIRICTVNRGLALSVQRMFWSLGIGAVAYVGSSEKKLRNGSSFTSTSCCYAVGTRRCSPDLCMLSAKLARNPDKINTDFGKSQQVLIYGDYAYLRVQGVRTFQTDPVMVYNLEVEGDHTYNAEGADVHNCIICGRQAKTAGEHCEHFKKHRGELFDDGSISCVMNDKPDFYDISGVDVPADRIAFVLKKVQPKESEDGENKTASLHEVYDMAANLVATRRAMPMTKAAFILSKLAEMEKRIDGIVEGDKKKLDFYKDDDEPEEDFITAVENFPSDEIVSTANRKGILLTPKMLFRILGKEIPESALNECEEDCCGDLSCMMRELQEDEDSYDDLVDGSFDQRLPVDLNLDRILEKFMPFFGMSDPAVNTRIIQITIRGVPAKKQKKEASFNKTAQEALRRTYARYLISFAAQNSDHVVMNAMMKAATIGK